MLQESKNNYKQAIILNKRNYCGGAYSEMRGVNSKNLN